MGKYNLPKNFCVWWCTSECSRGGLPLQMNNKSKGIEIDTRNPKHKSYNFEDSTRLGQTILEFVLSIELEDMSPQNVSRLIMKWGMDLFDMWGNRCLIEIL